MKRRNFLKAIGLGALVAPAVVSAASEKSINNNKRLDLAMHKAHMRDNHFADAMPYTETGYIQTSGGLTIPKTLRFLD